MKILKIIIKIIVAIVITALMILSGLLLWDNYKHYFWEPSAEIFPVNIDMTRSDIFFQLGEATFCTPVGRTCFWSKKSHNAEHIIVRFDDNEDVKLIGRSSKNWIGYVPFRNVEKMLQTLGEPDVIAVSKDYLNRRYTYFDSGFSFSFTENTLQNVSYGLVEWRMLPELYEYQIKGRKVCPGDDCPFTSDGMVKPEWSEKTVLDFISEMM